MLTSAGTDPGATGGTESTEGTKGTESTEATGSGTDGKLPSRANLPWSADQLKYLLQEAGLTPGLIDQWASSPERSWYLGRRFWYKPGPHLGIYVWVAVGLALLVVTVVVAAITVDDASPRFWTASRVVGAAFGVAGLVTLGWCSVPYWAARRAFRARRRAAARYSVDAALVQLRAAMAADGKRAELARMFELNRRQLDEYQELTKSQQRMAFALTWGAAVASLLILVIGSTVALRVGDADKYIAGGLTALGSLLSAFLGAVFFRGHEHAMNQLNHYYLEPSLTGRMLAVERMLEHLPDSREKGETAKLMMKWIQDLDFPPELKNGAKKTETPRSTLGPANT
jgi:hypothetical protein